jgi:hypothetical protein
VYRVGFLEFIENRIRHGLLGGYLQGGCWMDDGRLFPPPEKFLVC